MLRSKAFWAAVAAAVVAVLAYRGVASPVEASAPAPKRIAFITGGPGAYWDAAVAGAEAAAAERGISLDVRTPEGAENIEQQMQLFAVAGSADVDAIAISPIDGERQAEQITLVAGSKPVVTFDSDASSSARHGYVGTSNFSAGLVAGTLVKTAIPEGGKIAVLMANSTKENLIDRLAGFRTRIAESPVPDESPTDPRYQIVGVYTDDGDNQKCIDNLEKAFQEHPDLACILTMNSRQGPVVAKALAGRETRPTQIAFDTAEETLNAVEAGEIFAAIAQDPFRYGYEAVGMLDSLCRGNEQTLPVVGRASVHISVEPVTKDKVKDFRARLASRKRAGKETS